MMRARGARAARRAVLALAVATLLVPKAIASDASSASEGDRAALLVAGLGGAAAVAFGAAATTGSGVDLADLFKGSSARRTDAAFDAVFPKDTVADLTPKAYLALDSRDRSTTQVLRYLSGLGGDDLAQNRLISAKRGAPLVNTAWSRAIWCEEEQEICPEKNRDSGIWKPRAFSSSRTNTCNKARMLCEAGESWLADENGKPLSPERFKLLELMVAQEYIGEDKSLAASWDSLGAKVAGVGGGLGQCINQIFGARLHDLHAIEPTSTRRSARPHVRREMTCTRLTD